MGTKLFDIVLLGLLAGFVAFRVCSVFRARTGHERVMTIGLDWVRALPLVLLLSLVALFVFVAMGDHATPGMIIGLVAGCVLVSAELLLMAYWSVWAGRPKPPAERK
jgi:protein-S-isoprenylcysteine O-methyltransferase Ste14